MAGTLLGPDQIRKLNASYPVLVEHIKSLLGKDHTGVGLMRVHAMVESFDSDEMARIFRELSFISNREKLALVRAAVYELLAKEPALFIAPEAIVVTDSISEAVLVKPEPAKVFTPPQFKLNVNVSDATQVAKTDTKPTPPPPTSMHTSKVAVDIEEGNKRMAEHQAKLDAAAAQFREAAAPKAVEQTPNVIAQEVERIIDTADAKVLAELVAKQLEAPQE